MFDLAYYSLAETDLDGTPLEGKRAKRYFHNDNKGEQGLLKYRLKSNQGEARTHASSRIDKETSTRVGFYVIEHAEQEHGLFHRIYHASIPCDEIDTIIVTRLMEHIQTISKRRTDVAEYEERAKKLREERLRKINQIKKSINDIDKEQAGLTRNVGKVEMEIEEAEKAKDEAKKALKERRKQLIEEEIETLEIERVHLVRAKGELEEALENDLGSLDEELEKLAVSWQGHNFEKRRSLINFLVQEVVIDKISTHWMRVEVAWLNEEWGREERYFWREQGGSKRWTEAEVALLAQHYATMPRDQLMALLPDRAWQTIRYYGKQVLGIPRGHASIQARDFDYHTSHADLEFMRERGIPLTGKYTNWERLC